MSKVLATLLLVAALIASPSLAFAGSDWSKLSPAKTTKLGLYMTPQQAHAYKTANPETTLFVDVRTPEELIYVGAPTSIDANVPISILNTKVWNDEYGQYAMEPNRTFVADIEQRLAKMGLNKDSTVILSCRSGSRSAAGVNVLAASGFSKVYNQVEGFEGDTAQAGDSKGQRTVNGWKNSGLPWTYHLGKDVLYQF